ncbi:thymus-specific serine protease-like [Ochlerotatus camptorhynchus]|uniref:thymus-specific serine protease-like n=1 Tax=Ochlerotatus camptorhynchus TaxID=644619 RepID=UPI0031CF8098
MTGKVSLVFVAMLAALAAAAVEVDPSRPVLFGTHRIIPRAPAEPEDGGETTRLPVWNRFSMRKNHNVAQNWDFFGMRYVSNAQFYKPGGPVFLFVGGPWPLKQHLVEQGHFVDMAEEMNGYLVANEMRYIGESLPEINATRHSMRFLSTTQLQSDLARFIVYLRNDIIRDPNAKVILAGVGFSASLAQWTRQRFPHLVQGVWSSSGMVEANSNFMGFAEQLGANIRQFGSNDCYSAIWRGFRITENLIDAGLSETVDKLFNVCQPIDAGNSLEVEAFFYGIFNEIVEQTVNHDLRDNIPTMCEALTDNSHPDSMTALGSWLTSRFPEADCLAMDVESIVEHYDVTDWHDAMVKSGDRQWLFLRCTELGWPLTSDSSDQPFGFRFSTNLFHQVCQRLFDAWLSPDVFEFLVDQTNDFQGGRQPDVRRVFFTHGSLDPWHLTGVTEMRYNNTYVNIIPGAFHGEDLASISDDDHFELKRSKRLVTEQIRNWLNTSYP